MSIVILAEAERIWEERVRVKVLDKFWCVWLFWAFGESPICLASDWFLKIGNLTYQIHMTLWSQQTLRGLPAKFGYIDVSEVPGTHVLMCTTSLSTWSPDHAMPTVPKACDFTSWNFIIFLPCYTYILLNEFLLKIIIEFILWFFSNDFNLQANLSADHLLVPLCSFMNKQC